MPSKKLLLGVLAGVLRVLLLWLFDRKVSELPSAKREQRLADLAHPGIRDPLPGDRRSSEENGDHF